MKPSPTPQPTWLETQAEVTACKYEFGGMNTLTLGFATDSNHFLIDYTYRAHGRTYTDQFTSPTYLEQGQTFTLTYNPLAPQQNSMSAATPLARTPLFAVAIGGSIVLSLLYLAMLHGCH